MLRAAWRWIRKSRWRQWCCGIAVVFLILTTGWFWSDFCLWRAESNLALRNNVAAEQWLYRSEWGRKRPVRDCLVRLRLARRQRRFQEVPQLLRRATQLGVPMAEVRREQWLAMAQIQQFDEVSKHWSDLLADPRDDEPEIARSFVIWASSMHRLDDALRVIGLWEQDYPDDPEPFALQGQLFQALNHWEGAAEAYRKALERSPNNNDYRFSLAVALQNRMQLDEALVLFQKCVDATPDNLAAMRGLAETCVSKGELDKALGVLQDAMKRFPDDVDLHQTLGEAYLAKGDAASAVAHLERIHAARPENADVAYSLARALKAVKRDTEAAPLFEFVAESRVPLNSLKSLHERYAKERDLELLYQMAEISAKYKSRQEAIRWLEKLLLISPNHRAAHELIGELYRITGQPEKADRHRKIADGLPKPTR